MGNGSKYHANCREGREIENLTSRQRHNTGHRMEKGIGKKRLT
jgi:hypothetical protein